MGSVGGGSLSGDPTTATAAAALAATAGAAVSEQQDEGEQQMLDEVALEDAPVAAAAPKEVEVEPLRVSHEAAVAAELKAAADAEEEVAAAAVRPPATSHYHSRLMQQLTAEDGEGEEAEGVDEAGTPQPQEAAGERSSAASAGAEPAPAPPLSSAAAAGIAAVAAVPAAAIATTSTAVAAATTGGRMEPLSVEAGSGSGSAGGGDEAAAAPPQPPLASAPLFPQQWYETFQGELRRGGGRELCLLSVAHSRGSHGLSVEVLRQPCDGVNPLCCPQTPPLLMIAASRCRPLPPARCRPAVHGRRGCAGPPRGGGQRRWVGGWVDGGD